MWETGVPGPLWDATFDDVRGPGRLDTITPNVQARWRIILYYLILYYTISYHIILYYGTSLHYTISYHITLHYIISYHIIWCYIPLWLTRKFRNLYYIGPSWSCGNLSELCTVTYLIAYPYAWTVHFEVCIDVQLTTHQPPILKTSSCSLEL